MYSIGCTVHYIGTYIPILTLNEGLVKMPDKLVVVVRLQFVAKIYL